MGSQQWREEMRGKLSRVDTSTLSPEKKRQFQALWARLSDEPTGGGVFDSLPLENLMVPLLVVAGALILWVQNGAAPAKVSGSQLGGAASGTGTSSLKVVWVQVGLVLVGLGVTVVTVRDDWIEKIGPNFVGFFITSNASDSHDEGMSWVVDTGLDGHVESVTSGCLDISELGVHFLGQDLGHVVVVLGEVWVVLSGIVGLLNTGHLCSYGYSQTIKITIGYPCTLR